MTQFFLKGLVGAASVAMLVSCTSDEELEAELAQKNQKALYRSERNELRKETWDEKFSNMSDRSDARYDAWFRRVMD